MKTLELELNKRLLIVEYETEKEADTNVILYSDPNCHLIKIGEIKVKLICKGSDLTEDIAKGFLHQSIHTGLFAHYAKGIPVNTYCYKTALEAFDAVIYAYGYHWGESPVKLIERGEASEHERVNNQNEWHKKVRKFRTFNPEKTLIFEIL